MKFNAYVFLLALQKLMGRCYPRSLHPHGVCN